MILSQRSAAVRAAAFLLALAGCTGAIAQSRPAAQAAEVFASPSGSGGRSGRSAADSVPLEDALRLAATAARPLRIVMAAGSYDLSGMGTVQLREGSGPLVIEGAGDATRLVGDHRPGSRGGAAVFTLARSNVTFRNFSVSRVLRLIDVPNGATAGQITISHVAIADVRDGIVIDRDKQLVARGWRIEDVRIDRHERVGIRLAGTRTGQIAIRRTKIDGGGASAPSDCFKGGIQLLQGVSDVTIENVEVRGNIGCEKAHYQQGDGIEIDDRQAAPQRITLRKVVSAGNRDGNFDLKARDVVLEDVVARMEGLSRYGFRMWNYDYSCVNCRVEGQAREEPGSGGIQLVNARLRLRNGGAGDVASLIRCGDREKRPSSVYTIETAGRPPLTATCPPPKRD